MAPGAEKIPDIDSFVKEIWLIKGSICLYHEAWDKTPFNANPQLFSGFFTALLSFSKRPVTAFPAYFYNIDFNSFTTSDRTVASNRFLLIKLHPLRFI